MGQPPAVVQAGPPVAADDGLVWKPIAPEHYHTSLVPWMSVAGRDGEKWLKARTKPSPDPGLLLITEEVYDLWKAHATGAGRPFPKEVVKRGRGQATEEIDPADTPGWRAALVLVPLAIILFLVILYVILTHHS